MQPLPIVYVQNLTTIDALVSHYKREVEGRVEQFRFGRPGQPVNPDSVAAAGAAGDIDWTSLITRFIASATELIGTFTGDPEQKKAAVVAAALKFYDDVVAPLAKTAIGRPLIFNLAIDPLIRAALPKLVGGVYDGIARIFDRKATAAPTTPAAPPVAPNLPAGFEPY